MILRSMNIVKPYQFSKRILLSVAFLFMSNIAHAAKPATYTGPWTVNISRLLNNTCPFSLSDQLGIEKVSVTQKGSSITLLDSDKSVFRGKTTKSGFAVSAHATTDGVTETITLDFSVSQDRKHAKVRFRDSFSQPANSFSCIGNFQGSAIKR